MQPGADGRVRVVIEGVQPQIDCGRFPVKRTVGEEVVVEADVFADGHDLICCVLCHQCRGDERWQEAPMTPLGNDRWRASFSVKAMGRYAYTVKAWVDPFRTWQRDLEKRLKAGQDVSMDLLIGANLVEQAAGRARGEDAVRLRSWAAGLREGGNADGRVRLAFDEELTRVARAYPDQRFAASLGRELEVVVDRERARFSAWYEFFPRSAAAEPGRHGTFRDCERWLPYIADLGFDVVYLPPIHPVGRTFRKGKNNAVTAQPDDVGSPWGIGAAEGGHTAIHPQLGTLEDFRRLLDAARAHGIEVALDVAFQCSPDHPWVKEHRDWFRERPDGTIQYAENPPKKYQDIYPIDFETADWQALWQELRGVIVYWVQQGVKIFRVDNPHTKSIAFWEWVINDVKAEHPDVLFLSEAFTRPRVMYRLAKLGFTQSYTYFAWRNTKWELEQYLTELTKTEVREFFRPNFWPNTPDILTEHLQHGGRGAFLSRLVLAATLTANYGIYGPAFEQCEGRPREPGSEEYLNSEKYELRHWDLDHPDSLKEIVARVNRIRKDNPALHADHSLEFHPVDNPQIICYSKRTPDGANAVVVVVNLDPYHRQMGWVDLPLGRFGLDEAQPYQMRDLLGGGYFLWQGSRNFVDLDPHVLPANVFTVRRRVRTERDFDYYL